MRRPFLPVLLALLVASAPQAAALVDPGTGTTYETAPVTVPMTFPVAGRTSVTDTYLVCRSGCTRMHMGQDISGAKLLPLLAAFDGIVTTLQRDSGSGNYVGITADRGPARGWTALYLHVNNDTPGTDDGRGTAQWAFPGGIELGARVLAGQLVGWLGDSGNAESTGAHLHFELRQGTGWSGTVHNPYPSLVRARRLAAPLPSGPHPDGTLVRHPTGALFLLEGGGKRAVSPGVLASHGLGLPAAVPMTAAESLGYPTAAALRPRSGSVVVDPAGTTWLLHGDARSRATAAQRASLGLVTPRVHPVVAADLTAVPEVPLPETATYPGALLRVEGNPAVLRVAADGGLRAVSAQAMWSHGFAGRDVAVLPDTEATAQLLAQRPALPPLALRDGTIVQTPAHRVAVLSGGFARRLQDARMVAAYGYTGRPRVPVGDELLSAYPTRPLTG